MKNHLRTGAAGPAHVHPRRSGDAVSSMWAVFAVALAGVVLWSGCRAPVTGRRQILLIPESREVELGLASYRKIIDEHPVSGRQRYVELVRRVGERIAAVAGRPDYEWEFQVIDSEQQNAFCLPGGKVAVYEGIIPICLNEAGLAVVISHEVAHALARHGGERMSHKTIANFGKQAVGYMTRSQDDKRQQILLTAYGVGSKYMGILPYSRRHESEADEIGIRLMAKAGYDPREAPRFWERFARVQDDSGVPEFLSTHPSDERRAEDLSALVPKVTELYENAPAQYGLGETVTAGVNR